MRTYLSRAVWGGVLVRGATVALALAALCLGIVSQARSVWAEPGPRPEFTLKSDLSVRYDGRTFITCNTQIDSFTVSNKGFAGTPRFRVTVLAGADSSSFSIPGPAPGATYTRSLVNLNHNQPVVVLADSLHQVDELDESNNAMDFTVQWIPCL